MSARRSWVDKVAATALRSTPCEHHALVATGTERLGRCLECAGYVLTPFSISARFSEPSIFLGSLPTD